MRFQEGIQSLRHNRDNQYLLSGNEPYLKEQFIKASKVLKPEAEDFHFYPDDQSEIAGSLNSGSFFGERVLIFHNYDKMSTERFNPLIKETNECIIMSLTEDANYKSKKITELKAFSSVIECKKMREYGTDYPLWIMGKASERGYEMIDGAEDLLFKRVGPYLYTLSNELQKLFHYKGENKAITKADIFRVTSITSVSTSFDLFESLIRQDIKESLKCFRSICLTTDSYYELVSFIGGYLEKLYRMLLLRESGMGIDDISMIIGLPKFFVKTKYLPRALALGKSNICKYIDKICGLEVKLRTFKAPGSSRVLMENFFFNFAK